MNVGIISVAQTKFGELWNFSIKDIMKNVVRELLQHVPISTINAGIIGNMSGMFTQQEHLSSLLSDILDLNIPIIRCEAACASGGLAVHNGYLGIKSGKYDVVMVLGVEKMTDLNTEDVARILMSAADEWEFFGLTFPGCYALMARAYMCKYKIKKEQIANVSVINHLHGLNNPLAHIRKKINLEDVLNAPIVADPLGLLDCSPISDGGAGIVLASENFIKSNNIDDVIWIKASEVITDSLGLYKRDLEFLPSAYKAGKKAFKTSGLTQKDIDVLEVHDCFSINEILCLEALGFAEKGKGVEFIENKEVCLNGSIPTNTTGGLKSIGHPVGATGVRQIVDIVKQLQGKSINQIKNCKTGMSLNIGGTGGTSVVHILSNEV